MPTSASKRTFTGSGSFGKSSQMTDTERSALRKQGARVASAGMSPQSTDYKRRMDATQRLIKEGKPTGLAGDTAAAHRGMKKKVAVGRY